LRVGHPDAHQIKDSDVRKAGGLYSPPAFAIMMKKQLAAIAKESSEENST
jgi:hypothetical protein